MKTKTNLIKHYLIITISIFFFIILTFSNSFAIDIATDFQTIKDVDYMTCSPDGKYLLTKVHNNGCYDLEIWEYSERGYKVIQTINFKKGLYIYRSFFISGNSKFVVYNKQSDNKYIAIFKLSNSRFLKIQTINLHIKKFSIDIKFSPDGKFITAEITDETFKIWKLINDKYVEIQIIKGKYCHGDIFSPHGQYLVSDLSSTSIITGNVSNKTKIWKFSNGIFSEIQTIKGGYPSFNSKGNYLITKAKRKTIIWELSNGVFSEMQTINRSCYWANDDNLESGRYSPIIYWKLSNDIFVEFKTLWHSGLVGRALLLTLSPNDDYLVEVPRDNNKKIIVSKLSEKSSTRHDSQTLDAHSDYIRVVTFSPDGKYFASGSIDKSIKIWKLSDGKFEKIQTIKEHTGYVNEVFFIKNYNLFVSIGERKPNEYLSGNNIIIKKWNYRELCFIDTLKKIITAFKNIEITNNEEMLGKTKNLCKPKGEFETQTQYDERIKVEKKQKHQFEELYAEKKRKEMKKIQNEIDQQLMITFPVSFSSIQLGKYNTEKEKFSVTINGTTENVKVPLNSARDFKENKDNYQIIGERKYYLTKRDEIKSEIINVRIKTPEGQVYAFGKQTEHTKPTYAEKSILPPKLEITSLKFTDENNDNWLSGDENGKIIINIENKGKGSAYGIIAEIKSKDKYSFLNYVEQQIITELKPDGKKTLEFLISADYNTPQQNCEFSITFEEANGFQPDPVEFSFQTKKLVPPVFFVEKGINDANGNFTIETSEIVKVTVRLANTGGQAKDVSLSVKKGNNVFFTGDTESRFTWNTIEKGDFKDISFDFYTNKKVKDAIPLSVIVQANHFSQEFPLNMKIKQREISPQSFAFKGNETEEGEINIPDLIIDIEQNIPQSSKKNINALAIIFGIENYRNISNVNFAFRDATIMKEYFSNTIGIPKEQIYFRANDEVTLGEFRKIFSDKGWLDKRVIENETDIYFYYAGHGAPAIKEEKAFLIPSDGDPNYPVQTGYSLEVVFENLSKLNANSVTVFLDACFTGANRENEMLLAGARPVSIQLKNNYVNNVTVFSATSNNEISSSYPKNKHGLFSYFLMKGMQGKADTNKDNKLTINELFDYTKKNVSRIAGTLDREQTPQLECLEPEKIIINY